MNDDELEAMFRGSLSNHAAEAVPSPDPVGRAHAGARRRRRVMAAVAGAAAVVVIAPAAVFAVTLGHDGSNPSGPHLVTTEWRAESYNGIELRVPATWGWGWGFFGCRSRLGQAYVARPTAGTIGCSPYAPDTVSHVWFDSPEPVGTGPHGKTVRVEGLTEFNITVADQDATELQQILDSIHSVTTDSNGCPQTRPNIPRGSQDANLPNATSASVCLYYTRSGPNPLIGRPYLYYSTRVDRSVPALVRAINEAGPGLRSKSHGSCFTLNGLYAIDLIVRSADASTTYAIPSRVCIGQPIGYAARPEFHQLTKESVAMWAVDGVPVYAQNGMAPNYVGHYLP